MILQANSTTVSVLDKKQLDTFRKRYTTQMGDPPQPDVEVTDTQLSAYACLLELGLPPAVDFGVWGPHGARLERDMYFKDQYLTPSGEWRSRELRGPDCLEAWESCYDVFKTAALMHGTAMAATLDTYAANFKRRVRKYHWCWHLALQADWRCRSEFGLEERRRQEAFYAASPQLSTFNPLMPWNSVIKAAASDLNFWHEQLSEPAILYKRKGGPEVAAERADGAGGGGAGSRRDRSRSRAPTPRRGNPKEPKSRTRPGMGGNDEQRADGRFLKHSNGQEICFAWGRSDRGCADTCKSKIKRAHVCEFCRTGHRTVRCPVHPSWEPPAPGGAPKRKAK